MFFCQFIESLEKTKKGKRISSLEYTIFGFGFNSA